MPSLVRPALAAAFVALLALPLSAQQPAIGPTATTAPLAADLLMDLGQLEAKMTSLARAIPADKFDWRPAPGVRSVNEVLMHVAADNYFMPAAIGFAPHASTGVKGDDFKTAQAFERRTVSRDSAIAEMSRSFVHLRQSLAATGSARIAEKVSMFGQSFTVQQAWIITTTHLHEHLGQLIAYARGNGIAPPWGQ